MDSLAPIRAKPAEWDSHPHSLTWKPTLLPTAF